MSSKGEDVLDLDSFSETKDSFKGKRAEGCSSRRSLKKEVNVCESAEVVFTCSKDHDHILSAHAFFLLHNKNLLIQGHD